ASFSTLALGAMRPSSEPNASSAASANECSMFTPWMILRNRHRSVGADSSGPGEGVYIVTWRATFGGGQNRGVAPNSQRRGDRPPTVKTPFVDGRLSSPVTPWHGDQAQGLLTPGIS